MEWLAKHSTVTLQSEPFGLGLGRRQKHVSTPAAEISKKRFVESEDGKLRLEESVSVEKGG
jgi:hypothetical protein